MSNKLHDELRTTGRGYTAGELLDIMRPKVEEILQRRGKTNPPSQSQRTNEYLHWLEESFRRGNMSTILRDDPKLLSDWHLLRDFLSVHRTVWILEGRAG